MRHLQKDAEDESDDWTHLILTILFAIALSAIAIVLSV